MYLNICKMLWFLFLVTIEMNFSFQYIIFVAKVKQHRLNFFHWKQYVFEKNKKRNIFEVLLSYHGNTIKLFICTWKNLNDLNIINMLYAIILLFIAKTAAISYNLCSKELKMTILKVFRFNGTHNCYCLVSFPQLLRSSNSNGRPYCFF